MSGSRISFIQFSSGYDMDMMMVQVTCRGGCQLQVDGVTVVDVYEPLVGVSGGAGLGGGAIISPVTKVSPCITLSTAVVRNKPCTKSNALS